MEVHKPKPVHGWRELLTEIGVIVIGVMIALAAEQVVESWRLHRQSEENERAFRTDLREDVLNAEERIALRPCVAQRLQELAAKLNAGSSWSANPQQFAGRNPDTRLTLPETLHTPSREWPMSSWETGLHSEAIRLLPEPRRLSYEYAFTQVGDAAAAQNAQASAERALTPLSYAIELTPELRAHYLDELGEVDHQEEAIQLFAEQMTEAARDLDALPDPKLLADLIRFQRGYRGACVRAVKLPSPRSHGDVRSPP